MVFKILLIICLLHRTFCFNKIMFNYLFVFMLCFFSFLFEQSCKFDMKTFAQENCDHREYILFRDVEHCGTSSAPGISSTQFRNRRNSFNTEFLPIPEWPEFSHDRIPSNSGIPRNSVRFRNCNAFTSHVPSPSPSTHSIPLRNSRN